MLIQDIDPILTGLANPAGCEQITAIALPFEPETHCAHGVVQVYAKGGTPPYEYSWNNGITYAAGDDAYEVAHGSSGYVFVRDSATPTQRIGIARRKIEERPRMKIVYDKRNFCEAANPDTTGAVIIKGLEHGMQGVTYDWTLVQTFDDVLNQAVNVTVQSGNFNLDTINATPLTSNPLTPGNYNLTVTPQGSNCPTNVRFTICNNCADSSSDHPDQEGGCGCCGEDCVSDTTVNISGLGN